MKKRIIIPCRLESTRLPNKVLLDIAGKPMLQHVYEKAVACEFDSVIVATDNKKIKQVAESFGADVCMTKTTHQNGTDRIAEACELNGYASDDVIVNLQADEPLIPIVNVKQVAANLLANKAAGIATLCEKITNKDEVFDPNSVKVVLDKNNFALYFSRASVPWYAGSYQDKQIPKDFISYRHIGLYAYSVEFLKQYPNLEKSPLETIERLEQLRALWHGFKIHVDQAKESAPAGVDTMDDLKNLILRLDI